jgi:D-lactate dehydrogenase
MSKASILQPPDPFSTLVESLRDSVADISRVKTRSIDLHANANDASHFLLIPKAVVIAQNAEEVGKVLRAARKQRIGVTLRSGGTSLSGQAVTDGVLVDVRRNFTSIEILDDGARVRVQPGVTVRALNARLARFNRKFGPDPASEVACTIGGVIANNSSGMACGTNDNAYRTLESIVVVLPSGYILDTATPDANQRLREIEPELFVGLDRLIKRVRQNRASVEKITQQYSMKNTMGYGLNAFLDFDTPVDVFAHLIVGSEGTLGFVAEATFRTIPLKKFAATSLLIFPDLATANTHLSTIIASGAATIELMDALSLRVGQGSEDVPLQLRDLAVDGHSALLVEYQATSAEELADVMFVAQELIDGFPLSTTARLSTDGGERAALWHLRKGLYATVAGARPPGTTALLEDIVVPVEALTATCTSLINLFECHGYVDSVIFGHAKDGNVHFMLTDTFEGSESLDRFRAFTEDMVDLVLSAGGSLKAEHGTGRMMAPFVRRQFGDELYAVMKEIKRLCDPTGTMNPGVLLSEEETGHLQSFKSSITVEEEVDRCVECGYCEPVCPSRNLTLTPRQRIVLRRATASARANGNTFLADELERDQEYDSIQTCAVDGMCQTACPVSINTGSLVRRLREHDSNRELERRD